MSNTKSPLSLESAYQLLPDPIAIIDMNGLFTFCNDGFTELFDGDTSLINTSLCDWLMLDDNHSSSWQEVIQKATDKRWSGQAARSVQGDRTQRCNVSLVSAQSMASMNCLILRLEPKQSHTLSNEKLEKLAYRDSLTGLANRSLFLQLFDHEISHSQRLGLRFATLFIDLDKFKQVNDSLGHDAGDALICTIAERLQKALRKSDLVARLGGDEFAVIMNNVKDSETIAKVTEKLIREISKPVKSGANVMSVGCSVGISVYPDNAQTADQLIQQSDAAMYRAKHQGGNNYCYFSDALNQELQDIRLIEQQLSIGLEESQFVPYFQPVIDKRLNRVVGVECLARWQHPERGVIGALEFIPIAMRTGLLHQVFEQVLGKAFSYIKRWSQTHELVVPLSINIASKQFYQQRTFDLIEELMKKHAVTAELIRIEVTESTLQESGSELIEGLKRIKLAGFSITLDDFGTGYSSLRYLQQLPVDTLKIDRSFVRNLDNNPHDKVIVKAIIQLAETLDIVAVAEGVENQAQSAFLSDNNCHIMQGFLFSPALPEVDFSTYIEQFNKK